MKIIMSILRSLGTSCNHEPHDIAHLVANHVQDLQLDNQYEHNMCASGSLVIKIAKYIQNLRKTCSSKKFKGHQIEDPR